MSGHKYVIVGGVAGGMSAAARLRRLDEQCEIIVLEQGPAVSFASCGLPYFVGGEIEDEAELLVQTPQSLRDALNIDVRLHHRVVELDAAAHLVKVVTPNGQQDISYDQLILSPGTVAARPPIDGLDHPSVHTLRTVADASVVRELVTAGAKHAVVLGAGFIGLEAAEGLHLRGVDVTLLEAAPHVLPPLEVEMAWLVGQELRRLGMDVREGVAVTAITDDQGRAVVHLADGQTVVADLVLLSAGTVPASAVFKAGGVACNDRGAIIVDDQGHTNLIDVWAVGDVTVSRDAVTGALRPVPLAGPAQRAGRLVADAIAGSGRARPFPEPLATAIVRVGDLTAAMTGANRMGLDAAGMPFTTLHLHPLNHAGYFPGGSQIHLMVHIDPVTGRLLGAQAVGKAGVDKRIDVLATALRAGLAAQDLIDLDLCYSPPYGSAKDAVTMVGFLADNVLTGQTALWQPDEVDWARQQAFVLDVRTPAEFATGHLPEAVNIAHTQVRARLDEVIALAGGRPIAVMCQSGVRSYLAHRILVAAGLTSRTLSGGMLTLRAWLGGQADAVLVKGDKQ
ncbi:MAG: FAD-dependent oxidoreductase [Propionibacteriaceae bacterium]|nr:FAD-dependent oxidoreductase [Propionibacteriaceae bacterium]